MSKDRNCGGNTPYPVYPMYGNMQGMPGPLPIGGVNMPMPMPMPMPTPTPMMTQTSTPSYTASEINTLSNQINNLEQRVSNLEKIVNNAYSSNYNTSNYQIM